MSGDVHGRRAPRQLQKIDRGVEMQDIYLEWTRLMQQYDEVAPKSVGKAILVSDQFVTMATQVEAIMSTAYSIWLACVLVVLVVVFCTG